MVPRGRRRRRVIGARQTLYTGLIGVLAICGGAQAAESQPGVLRWNATGVQIYACKDAGGRAVWTFEHPEAVLVDETGRVVLHHGAGPSWTANDGSVLFGAVLTSVPSPDAGSVPWLVLRASKHEGAGLMTGVAFVLRTDTKGGVAPASGCDPAHAGAESRVPYTATYTFLVEPEQAAH